MTNLFYQVLTPNGWVNPNEAKKIYSVDRNLEISSEEVRETIEVDTLIHHTSADQTWSGFTAWDLSLLYFQDDFGVANGDFQHTDLTVGEMTGKHLFTNIGNLRVTVPTKFECMDFQTIDDTRYPNYFVNLVKSKNVCLKVQHFSKTDALSFLETWRSVYGDLLVEDDQMAKDMQHVLIRAGYLSTVDKTPLGRIRVNPIKTNKVLANVKLGNPDNRVLKYINQEGKQIHAVCRSPVGSVFIL